MTIWKYSTGGISSFFMGLTSHALRVYATLEGLKTDRKEDVLDALIPFLIPVLEILNGKVFDPELLISGLRKLYGWNLTRDIADQFGARLESNGYLKRPSESAHILLVEVKELGEKNPAYTQEIEEISKDFRNFIYNFGDLLFTDLGDEELLDKLVKFIISIDINNNEEHLRNLQEVKNYLTQDDCYLCAKYIEDCNNNKPDFVDKLGRLASVGMLTEVVQDFVQPTTKATPSETTVVLDAPLALSALGVSGNLAKRDVGLTLEAIKGLGCRVHVFDISCDEMTRILRTTLGNEVPNRYGPTHTAIINNEVKESFVESVMMNPERALVNIGISVRQIDLESTPSIHIFFDSQDYTDFLSAITWKPEGQEAQEHDAVCMTLISRLRARNKAVDIFDNKYLFVTSNKSFSSLAQKYSIERHDISHRHCSPVIHQSVLAVAAWLRTGFQGASEIPTAHLLAHCERILSVRAEVIEKAKDVLRSLPPIRNNSSN